jgi:subtilisin family serine protease
VAACAPSGPAVAAEGATGEIIVRFEATTGAAERAQVRDRVGVTAERDLLLPDTQLVRAAPGVAARAAIAALEADPRVRYAEPNRLLQPLRAPDDPGFGGMWNLQTIAAPPAWDVTVGSDDVKLAVLDTGIDHLHPDLAENHWQNPGEARPGEARNGIDDDGNGFVDDVHGWDFDAHHAWPLDRTGHGSAVAGVAGATGDNGVGLAGVSWDVSLAALKVGDGPFPMSAIVDATVYAGRIGADVANMSFGSAAIRGSDFSRAHRDAIAGAADTLFVAAAGNGNSDNDSDPFYPCSYELPNLICVTGTDGRDQLVYNHGRTSVHLAAPGYGVPVMHPLPREVFRDDFEQPTARWDYAEGPLPAVPGTWRRITALNSNRVHVLTDSEGGDYENGADASVTLTEPIDLSAARDCFVTLDAVLDSESSADHLRIEGAGGLSGPWHELTRASGGTGGRYETIGASLERFEGGGVHLRLRLTSDAQNAGDGALVDDVRVRCYDASSYAPGNGTSFAAPHVAGAAALVKSHMPGLSVAELRERLLRTVDPLPSLQGKTVTGGRLNVARALTADLDPAGGTVEPPPPDEPPSEEPPSETPPPETEPPPRTEPEPEPEPEPGGLVAPNPDDPKPVAWGPVPRLVVRVPRQPLGRVLRRGLAVVAAADGDCPCRVTHALRRAGRRRVAGRTAAAIEPGAPRRLRVRLRTATRAALAGRDRLDAVLASTLVDRHGRTLTTARRLRLRR